MAEEHSLPGWPKKKLVKEVRRHLSHFGIRPIKFRDLAGDLGLGSSKCRPPFQPDSHRLLFVGKAVITIEVPIRPPHWSLIQSR